MNNQILKVILETERLIMRTWKNSDIALMAAISADPVVMEYFPFLQDLTATKAFIDRINLHYEKFGYALYAVEVRGSNDFIGFVGLNHPAFEIPNMKPKEHPVVEIGWRLASKYWRKGYATEAAKAVLHYSFTQLKLDEVISFTVRENMKSRRVMEKIGLRHHVSDIFDHPNISEHSKLRQQLIYRLGRDEYLNENARDIIKTC